MIMSNDWNPLYLSNEDVDALEEAAREAEWEDNMRELEKKKQQERRLIDDDSPGDLS